MWHRVFVYGSLKKNNPLRGINLLMDSAKFVGDAYTTKSAYSMYSFDTFPGVTLNGKHRIKGEVWEVDDDGFELLDHIEGYPDFFQRRKVSTTMGTSWLYYIHDLEDVEDCMLVPLVDSAYVWNW